MGAAKPALLQFLAGLDNWRPQCRLIIYPKLVDREGVSRIFDDPAQFGIVERVLLGIEPLQRLKGDPERPYSIPHAEEFDLDFTRIAAAENLCLVGVGPLIALTVKSVGVANPMRILAQQEAAIADHPDQAARSVCT